MDQKLLNPDSDLVPSRSGESGLRSRVLTLMTKVRNILLIIKINF